MTERTGYRLRKVKCKFKPNLALAWRTSTDPVVLWLSSFVAVPCLINRTRCILPTPPLLLTLPSHTRRHVWALIIYVLLHRTVIVGPGSRASWR